MLGLERIARSNEMLSLALVGQGLLDEGSILTDKIEIFYNDRNTALFLFRIAKGFGLANRFRKKMALKQTKFGFTIVSGAWVRLYSAIGPLPDKRKDLAFRFLLRQRSNGAVRPAGESKRMMLDLLSKSQMTCRELCYALGLSGSTVRRHLAELAAIGKVTVIGKNRASASGKNRSALVWALAN